MVRWTEAKEAELAKAIPWGHAALVLLEGVIPRLGGAPEMVGGEPSAVRRESTLPIEELLALVEPVEGALRAVVGGELEFGIAGRHRGSAAMDVWLSAGRGRATKPEEVASE
jgi:hypothetical protein